MKLIMIYAYVMAVGFVMAGVLALIMRTQLALPESELVSQGFYNQVTENICNESHRGNRAVIGHSDRAYNTNGACQGIGVAIPGKDNRYLAKFIPGAFPTDQDLDTAHI